MFALNLSPAFRRLPVRIEDRIAIVYREPVKVPRALPVSAPKPAPREFGKRKVGS